MFLPEIYKLTNCLATREVVYVVGRKIARTDDGTDLIVSSIQKDYSKPHVSSYRIFVKEQGSDNEHLHEVLENCRVSLTINKNHSY